MNVKELIEILSKVELDKKVFVSKETALVELKKQDVTLQLWGVTIK